MKHIFLLFFTLIFAMPAAADMKIVASYPPIQSLAWSITDGITPVNVMFNRPVSGHHNVTLRPSELKILKGADIIFYASDELETFMSEAVKKAAPNALVISLADKTANLKITPSKITPTESDLHFWLNPDNAVLMLAAIRDTMIQKDPKNTQKYTDNYQNAKNHFDSLKKLKGNIKNKKIIALHDGFSYINDYFDLDIKTLPVDVESITSPKAIMDFKSLINKEKADCIIIEPDLNRRQINVLGLPKDSLIKMDAFGWNIKNGVGQYYKMMRWNMRALDRCGKEK